MVVLFVVAFGFRCFWSPASGKKSTPLFLSTKSYVLLSAARALEQVVSLPSSKPNLPIVLGIPGSKTQFISLL